MNVKNWARKSFVLMVLLIVLVGSTSCRSRGAPGIEKIISSETQDYWTETVVTENHAETIWLSMLTTRNEGLQSLRNQYPLLGDCFDKSGATLEDAISGRYDYRDTEGKPTGQINTPLLIEAVVEAYPDLTVCQEMAPQLAQSVEAWRLRNADATNALWDVKGDLDNRYGSELEVVFVNGLLQFAGTEFMKSGLATKFAPPIVWFPTFNLEAFVTGQERCDKFRETYPGQAHWNSALERCKLISQAAYDVIFRPILSLTIIDEINTGIDQTGDIFNTDGE